MTGMPLDLLMFAGLFVLVLIGAPIAFVLVATAVIFGLIGLSLGELNFNMIGALPSRIFDTMVSEALIAIPLFVFMGMVLERSRIAEDLLRTMGALFGELRGGLGVSVTVVGALLAASTGIVGATTVTMGLMALPVMLRYGYNASYSSGVICSAGTLGQIIPPSTVLIIMGEVLASAYQRAQHSQGNFAAKTMSIGELFAGSLLPGLMLVGLYILYQFIAARLKPSLAPPIPPRAIEGAGGKAGAARVSRHEVLSVLIPPLVLIVAVLGSILGGIATATEAAAVGAVGATLLAGMRTGRNIWALWVAVLGLVILMVMAANFDLRLGRPDPPTGDQVVLAIAGAIALACAVAIAVIWRDLGRTEILRPAMSSTARTTSMIFTLIIGALLFSLVFRGLGGEERIRDLLESTPGGPHTMLFFVLFMMFLLGLFLDYVEITIIAIPVVGPPILAAGIDPIWFGVLIALTLQTSFLTPPVGYTLAYLRSVAPPSVSTLQIWGGAVPFILLQLLAVLIVYSLPGLATWLPGQLF